MVWGKAHDIWQGLERLCHRDEWAALYDYMEDTLRFNRSHVMLISDAVARVGVEDFVRLLSAHRHGDRAAALSIPMVCPR